MDALLPTVRAKESDGDLILPVGQQGICAGFPSPAEDYMDDPVDLGRLLVPNPAATYLWRVDGHSMVDAGVHHGDVVVVDRSLEPRHGDVVVAVVDGEPSLKRLHIRGGRMSLSFENRAMRPYGLAEGADVQVWGVVRCNVHWPGGRR